MPALELGAADREALALERPGVWFTPQLHNGAAYGDERRENGDVVGRAPTLTELRFGPLPMRRLRLVPPAPASVHEIEAYGEAR